MIDPKFYQQLAVQYALQLKDHKNWMPLRGSAGDLMNMIEGLNQESLHAANSPENLGYHEKRNVLRDRGNLLWQNLTALSAAMKGGDKEKQQKALDEAATALQGFDYALDDMQNVRFWDKLLQDSARSNYAGENVSMLFSNYGHTPRHSIRENTTKYLQELGAQPYAPKKKTDPAFRVLAPVPAPRMQKRSELEHLQNQGFETILMQRKLADRTPDAIIENAGLMASMSLAYTDMIKNGKFSKQEGFANISDKEFSTAMRSAALEKDAHHEPYFKGKLLGEQSDYLIHMMSSPEKMKDFCAAYETQKSVQQKKAEGKLEKNYDNYIWLHSRMNVPKGKEREYLAKCMAAQQLNGSEPYSLDKIRKEAKKILKNKNFLKLTANKALTRKLLMEGDTRTMEGAMRSMEDANLTKRMNAFREHPKSFPKKSWEGYLNAHLNMEIPKGQEALHLMKILYTISAIKMDKPNKEFSVSTVREKAKDMLDRKYLKLFADKPDLIRELLQTKDPVKISNDFVNTGLKLAEEAELGRGNAPKQHDSVLAQQAEGAKKPEEPVVKTN